MTELLVVIGIIALLATLILSGIGMIQEQSKTMATKQRIEQVHTQLATKGQEVGGAGVTYFLQTSIAGFGGTLEFDRANAESWVSPLGGGAWHLVYPEATARDPLVLGYPWGKQRVYHIRESWYTNHSTPPLAVNDPNTWTPAQRTAWEMPEEHDITELIPRMSAEILVAIGVADSVTEYRDDRDFHRPFNDAWGNPLVVSYALFQPPQYSPPNTPLWQAGLFYDAGEWVRHVVDGAERRFICIRKHESPADPSTLTNQPGGAAGIAYWLEALQKRDYYLDQARERYQYNRATYITVGAPGSGLDPVVFPNGLAAGQDAAAWQGILANLWTQICAVTMPAPADLWDENGFNRPPWEGVKGRRLEYHGLSIKAFLSTPVEYK
jgi:type II secretory pathway pseudopilin PulG